MKEALKQKILQQGMSLEKVEEQIRNFKNNFPFLKIESTATVGDGIMALDKQKLDFYVGTYTEKSKESEVLKFVPASGAASRMFKNLFGFLESTDKTLDQDAFTKKFIDNLSSFAFYKDLDQSLKKSDSSIENALKEKDYRRIVAGLLEDEGLGYGSLPKGLLKFHRYEEGSRTPTFEHFVEGIQYCVGKGNKVRLHFTVSPEHQEKFQKEVAEIRAKLEPEYQVKFEVSFSQQKKSTDTIAVNMDNTPFEEENGEILFRPAGHGALLENLNDIHADLVFIKNVDNVVPDRLKSTTREYKMAIGGILFTIQEKMFEALAKLTQKADEEAVTFAEDVYKNDLGAKLPENYGSLDNGKKADFLKKKLNRPIRVCGMVKNTGEPGGGPFWVKSDDGTIALQIAETAQLDLEDEEQNKLFKASSHFNPTDLVCGVRDYRGNKFDLLQYRDPKTGFITKKSKNGKDLKAQELPGLWNGAMSDWNSVFVEIPLITFNPVKTINDLLREEHQ